MQENRNIFTQNIEVPEIVMQKAEKAFAEIKGEEVKVMKYQDTKKGAAKRRKRAYQHRAALLAGAVILTVTGTSAAAAYYYWGRGMNERLEATDAQRQELAAEGIAQVYSGEGEQNDLAVTSGEVTIMPETIIVEDSFAYLSFSIQGFSLEQGEEPCFGSVEAYLGENPEAEDAWVNLSGGFYDGRSCRAGQEDTYEDGSPLVYDDHGGIVGKYMDDGGKLEYIMELSLPLENEGGLNGKKLNVRFGGLGVTAQADYRELSDGNWCFSLELPRESAATQIPINCAVEGTNMILDQVRISPIAVKLTYRTEGAAKGQEDDIGIPSFAGLVMKDGTRYTGIAGSESSYAEEKTACTLSAFRQVIEPEQVAAVLIRLGSTDEIVEIHLS